MAQPLHCYGISGLILAGLSLSPIDHGRAQTLLDTATLYNAPAFPKASPASPKRSRDNAGSDDSAAASGARSVRPRLRHLPLSPAGWKIDGEIGSLNWNVYMGATEAADTRRFQMAYGSSASVLPGVSQLTFYINGVTIGRSGIAAPGDQKPAEFDVPPNVLRHGFNRVSIAVEQRHRVDCSVEATYELRTEIDPAKTGFVTTGSRFLPSTKELAALRPRADGSMIVRVLFNARMRPQRIDQTILAAQAIALVSKSERFLASFIPNPDADFGINLVVGTAAEIAGTPGAIDAQANKSGPTLLLREGLAGAAPTLVVSGTNDDEVAQAIAQLQEMTKVDETGSTNIQPDAGELRISGGERINFSQLGQPAAEFSGRFFRLPIYIIMPGDFLAADYGKLSFNLRGAYAADLQTGAQVQVNVNGRDAASVPLSNASGGSFRHDDIMVPIGALRPGRNTIEVTAKLPSESDRACDSMNSLDDTAKRFLLLGGSEIRFPELARVGRLPDLRQTAAGGYPYSIAGDRPKLYLPSPDRDSLSAALTLAVRLAVAANHPIPFSIVLSNPQRQPEHGLVVAPARALDPAILKAIGMDPDAVRRAWQSRAAEPDKSAASMNVSIDTTDRTSVDEKAPARQIAALPWPRELGTALHPVTRRASSEESNMFGGSSTIVARDSLLSRFAYSARDTAFRTYEIIAQAVSMVRNMAIDPALSRPADLTSAASIIVAQGYRNADDSNIITVVTAQDAQALARAVEALVDPSKWSGLRGDISVMNASAQLLHATEASYGRFVQTQPISFGNSRLIVAGWLSLHPAAYVLSALFIAALLAFATRALVKNVGRKTQ